MITVYIEQLEAGGGAQIIVKDGWDLFSCTPEELDNVIDQLIKVREELDVDVVEDASD